MPRREFSVGVPCLIEGCNGLAIGRGWCRRHYSRWHKHGTPTGGGTDKGARIAWVKQNVNYKGEDCLWWPFACNGGRPQVKVGNLTSNAARIMCIEVHGEAPGSGFEAAHSCGRGQDGCVNPRHLRWATRSENQNDRVEHGTMTFGSKNPAAKLSEKQVLEIRRLSPDKSNRELAILFGMSRAHVCDIVARRRWRHL